MSLAGATMVTFSTLEPGAVFADRYRIERRIKAGGMGAVYAVRHVRTNAALALKVMNPELVADEGFRERFVQEAQIASLVDSPHVVQVTDADVDARTGLPFMVMELLRGRELGELLKERGRFSAEEVVAWLTQAARALDKAHAVDVVHRDLKPANLFLVLSDDEPPRVKILDFGIAKIVSRAAAATTHAGGTPLYMAPEQTGKSRRIGPWTDVWALGLIAYALLVGRSYWESETVEELYAELLGGTREQASVRAARAGVTLSREFDAWFAQCTDPEPQRRFARASGAIVALAQALGVSTSAPAPTPRPAIVTEIAPATEIARREPTELASPVAPQPATSTEPMPAGATAIASPVQLPVAARSAPEAQGTTTSPASSRTLSPRGSRTRGRDRRVLLYVVGASAVVAVVALGVALSSRSGGGDDVSATNAPSPTSAPSATKTTASADEPPSLSERVAKSNPWIRSPRVSVQRHEVTRGEYASFLLSLSGGERAAMRPLRDWPGEPIDDDSQDAPVSWIPHARARAFCEAIGARLPSPGEWRSALGGARYPWGDSFPPPGAVAFGRKAGAALPHVESSPTDRSALGVYDLFGSVREWTEAEGGFAVLEGVELDTPKAEAEVLYATPAQKLAQEGDDPEANAAEIAGAYVGVRCVKDLDAQ